MILQLRGSRQRGGGLMGMARGGQRPSQRLVGCGAIDRRISRCECNRLPELPGRRQRLAMR